MEAAAGGFFTQRIRAKSARYALNISGAQGVN